MSSEYPPFWENPYGTLQNQLAEFAGIGCGAPTFPCHPTRLTCTNSQLVSIWNPENSADWSVKK